MADEEQNEDAFEEDTQLEAALSAVTKGEEKETGEMPGIPSPALYPWRTWPETVCAVS